MKIAGRKAWVLTVDMGYGHQRAAYPFRDIAQGGVITVNDYPGLPAEERRGWEQMRSGYEWISRIGQWSAAGRMLFNFFDRFQKIPPFYPRRDLSHSNIQLDHIYSMIEQGGVGKHLFTEVLAKKPR